MVGCLGALTVIVLFAILIFSGQLWLPTAAVVYTFFFVAMVVGGFFLAISVIMMLLRLVIWLLITAFRLLRVVFPD